MALLFQRFIKYLCLYLYTPVNLPAGVIFIVHEMLPGELKRNRRNFGSYRKDEVSTHIQAFPEGTAQENNLSINSHLMRVGQGVLPYHILGGVQFTFPSTNCGSSSSHCFGPQSPSAGPDNSLGCCGGRAVFWMPETHLIFESPGQNHFQGLLRPLLPAASLQRSK